jgi:hypothetical protein
VSTTCAAPWSHGDHPVIGQVDHKAWLATQQTPRRRRAFLLARAPHQPQRGTHGSRNRALAAGGGARPLPLPQMSATFACRDGDFAPQRHAERLTTVPACPSRSVGTKSLTGCGPWGRRCLQRPRVTSPSWGSGARRYPPRNRGGAPPGETSHAGRHHAGGAAKQERDQTGHRRPSVSGPWPRRLSLPYGAGAAGSQGHNSPPRLSPRPL